MHGLFRVPVGAVEPAERESLEDLFDDRGVEARDRVEVVGLVEAALGRDGVNLRMEIRERSKRPDREHDGGSEVASLERRLTRLAHRIEGASREEYEHLRSRRNSPRISPRLPPGSARAAQSAFGQRDELR